MNTQLAAFALDDFIVIDATADDPAANTSAADYAEDFYAWTQRQAMLLRDGNWGALDIVNLIEELETMGRSERRELASRLEQLLLHLLKWHYQPTRRSRSWRASIRYQRLGIERLLDENPSLRPLLPSLVESVYPAAVLRTEIETNLSAATFPARCPYSTDQLFDVGWLPEEEAGL